MDAKTKNLVAGLRHILEQIESGKRQVVTARLSVGLGEPMSMSLAGTVWSQKVSIELELVPSGLMPPVAQDPSGQTPPSGAEGVVA